MVQMAVGAADYDARIADTALVDMGRNIYLDCGATPRQFRWTSIFRGGTVSDRTLALERGSISVKKREKAKLTQNDETLGDRKSVV